MPLKCVPLNPDWTSPSAKDDLVGIYARPKMDNFGQIIPGPDGAPQYDAVALPLRRHIDWQRKGFEYVTLADEESLGKAANWLRSQGLNPYDYANQDRRSRSPFNAEMWLEDVKAGKQQKADALQAMVDKHGVEATEEILKATQPGFVLPTHLRSSKKDKPKAGAAA